MSPHERKQIPPNLVDDILKELKYAKRSKQKVLCWCIITSNTPERITIEEYVEADRYFRIYSRHIRAVIAELNLTHRMNRKNLLNYNYLAYKIFELLSVDDPQYGRHMKWYKLLQGDDKIWVQDLIWKKICERAEWDFISTG